MIVSAQTRTENLNSLKTMHTSQWPRLLSRHVPILAALLLVTAARAQFVSDGGSATLDNFAADLGAGNLIVGTNGPNTTLIMTNGTVVNANNAYLGLNAGSSNNFLAVHSAGSRLSTAGNSSVFRIGNGSAFNHLLISQGGAVSNGFGVIGFPAAAGDNSVFVTGSGSSWSNNVLYVGEGGSRNSLTAADGAIVTANSSTIGVVAGANDNWVTVTGTNSLWNTVGNLLVGDAGGGSRLIVQRGGTVKGSGLILGDDATSTGNLLSVATATVAVTNVGGTGVLDVRRGNMEFNGGNILADRLLMTNGAGSFTFNDGTLITRSATINNGLTLAVGANVGTGPAGATFANSSLTTIPDSGTASPYPSVINVANVGGPITKLTVTLSNLWHTYPDDLDILLAGPSGQKVMLMSDAGGLTDVTNLTLTFDGAALVSLPDAAQITNGTYQPTDYDVVETLPAPVPPGPYSTNLADFNGTSANGAWSLYIVDDVGGDFGNLGAWSLNIVTTPTGATWDVRSNATPTVAGGLIIGRFASNARLLITNGGTLANSASFLGFAPGADNNVAVVAGAGSLWSSSSLHVGDTGSGNQLVAGDGGTVNAANVVVGNSSSSTNNRVTVDGGTLRATNASGTGVFNIRRGTNVLNAGLIETDNLLLTNSTGFFEFNGGLFSARSATVANGTLFTVGNGSSAANYQMSGTTANTHSFPNGLYIPNNASLVGNGTIAGTLTVDSGGTLAPGSSVGKIILNNTPVLQGSVVMEISKNGATLTNDQIQVAGLLSYGGSLTVSNVGPTPLVFGNSFQLFNASLYVGAFSSVTLPALPPGLTWADQLSANGSITVIGQPVPGIGGTTQTGANLSFNITNGIPGGTWKLITATNVALPVASWTTNLSGLFNGLGTVSVTNGVNPAEPQRYFRIKTP